MVDSSKSLLYWPIGIKEIECWNVSKYGKLVKLHLKFNFPVQMAAVRTKTVGKGNEIWWKQKWIILWTQSKLKKILDFQRVYLALD